VLGSCASDELEKNKEYLAGLFEGDGHI